MLNTFDGVSFRSTLLSGMSGVIHGFSSRNQGDMTQRFGNRDRFTKALGFKKPAFFAEQIHGTFIGQTDTQSKDTISGVDGLVSREGPVAVVPADCVPVLLVDPVNGVCSAVHAGWKGSLENIVGRAVSSMVKAGARTAEIYGVIGPHIGACCYDVPEDRIALFGDCFGADEKMMYQFQETWHLDIGWVNYRQLIDAGVSAGHIDAPPTCTCCQHDTFFSFRKDTKETFGKMMAVIGFGTI